MIETKINSITNINYVEKINEILEDYQIVVSDKPYHGTSVQKHFGIYYTNYVIAYKITAEAFKNFKNYNTPRKQDKKNQSLIPKELRYIDYFKG